MRAATILAVLVLAIAPGAAFALPNSDEAISATSQFGIDAAREASVLNAAGFTQYNP